MEWWQNGVNYGDKTSSAGRESNFLPTKHPNEPQDEDQPIKCPTPHLSLFNVSNEENFSDSTRKRTERHSGPLQNYVLNKYANGTTTTSHKERDNITDPSFAPPRHSFSAHDNLKMFPITHNFYKFES